MLIVFGFMMIVYLGLMFEFNCKTNAAVSVNTCAVTTKLKAVSDTLI